MHQTNLVKEVLIIRLGIRYSLHLKLPYKKSPSLLLHTHLSSLLFKPDRYRLNRPPLVPPTTDLLPPLGNAKVLFTVLREPYERTTRTSTLRSMDHVFFPFT